MQYPSTMAAFWKYFSLYLLCGLLSEAKLGEKAVGERPETLLRYRPAFNTTLNGKPFKINYDYISSLGLPPKSFTKLGKEFFRNFVFVTAATSDHFQESLDSLASMRKRVRHRRIIYFDLGLTEEQANQLKIDGGAGAVPKVICGVEYRKFDFSPYPPHVRDLNLYSWKFLIIMEMLKTFDGVYWMDTSVRLSSSYFQHVLEPQVEASGGIMLFTKPEQAHSNYAVTDDRLYDYFPTDIEAQKTVEQYDGGNILIYNTKEVYENVLKWMYLCVLEPDCISPTGAGSSANRCQFKEDRFREKADCHKHDQATLNLLLSNWFRFKTDSYVLTDKSISRVIRRPTNLYTLQWCDPLNVDGHDEL